MLKGKNKKFILVQSVFSSTRVFGAWCAYGYHFVIGIDYEIFVQVTLHKDFPKEVAKEFLQTLYCISEGHKQTKVQRIENNKCKDLNNELQTWHFPPFPPPKIRGIKIKELICNSRH